MNGVKAIKLAISLEVTSWILLQKILSSKMGGSFKKQGVIFYLAKIKSWNLSKIYYK